MLACGYEVKVDGEWVRVPVDTINNVVALDGGAHVCSTPAWGPLTAKLDG